MVSSSGSTVNPYKYIGRLGYYSDAGTGLMLLGSRFYDPEAGVFTQRDEAKDGLSYYAYTSGKVMTAVDPWGKSAAINEDDCKENYSKCYREAEVDLWNNTKKCIAPLVGLPVANAPAVGIALAGLACKHWVIIAATVVADGIGLPVVSWCVKEQRKGYLRIYRRVDVTMIYVCGEYLAMETITKERRILRIDLNLVLLVKEKSKHLHRSFSHDLENGILSS